MTRRISPVFVLALFVAVFALYAFARPALGYIPQGFQNTLITSMSSPTAIAFTPDARMLATTKAGRVRVQQVGSRYTAVALDIAGRICSNSERGLLGVAVDPDFEANRYVYLYYTKRVGRTCEGSRDDVNRVSRFTMSGNRLLVSSEKILLNNIPSPAGNHNGGDLQFGKDGNLYVSVGDGGTDYKGDSGGGGMNDASRDRNVVLGKVLRITPDGGIPADNPFTGPDSGRCNLTGRTAQDICQETFAFGLRNPFRMAFDPDAAGTRFFINDVGQRAREEIDEGASGADYGWNFCEGTIQNPDRASTPYPCDAASGEYDPPIHDYAHSTGCSSVTGGAFVPNDSAWPDGFKDDYLFGDFICGRIYRLSEDGGGSYTKILFTNNLGRNGPGPVHMAFGPSRFGPSLYYTTFSNGGEIRRISYSG